LLLIHDFSFCLSFTVAEAAFLTDFYAFQAGSAGIAVYIDFFGMPVNGPGRTNVLTAVAFSAVFGIMLYLIGPADFRADGVENIGNCSEGASIKTPAPASLPENTSEKQPAPEYKQTS